MTNGDESVLIKLTQTGERLYDVSRSFGALASMQELQQLLQVLKQLGQVVSR